MARILVVDDEENIRLLYRLELEDAGHEVETFSSGRGLNERLHRNPADLLILDIKMADISGLVVLEDVRREFTDLPVILSSAHGARPAGWEEDDNLRYVVKSSDPTALMETVGELLHLHAKRKR
jgi:DNA-binding NtrC family response regulator